MFPRQMGYSGNTINMKFKKIKCPICGTRVTPISSKQIYCNILCGEVGTKRDRLLKRKLKTE